MESVSIQIPAALYASLYERYREETTATITACICQLLDGREDKGDGTGAKPDPAVFSYLRPRAGTKTGRVWEIADRILGEGGAVNREAVIRACMAEDININTASTQFSHWRKANP